MKKIIVVFCTILLGLLSHISATPSFSENDLTPDKDSTKKIIYVIPVTGTIDLGLSSFIKRACLEAKEKKADAVVIKINTYGGRVDAADEIVAAIADLSPIPTFAYVTHSAWSAGALVAIACKEIIMQNGSSIGSAEPRIMGMPTSAQTTDEKIVSALRGKFKSTAEANGHSPKLAEAMVDMSIEIVQVEFNGELKLFTRGELDKLKEKHSKKLFKNEKVISAQKKLLNLTANESLRYGLSVKTVKTEKSFFDHVTHDIHEKGDTIKEARKVTPTLTWSENIVRFLTHPIVSPLLLSLGFLGILFELKMPGWGVSGTLGAVFIILFFWGHYLVGLADFADIGVFIIGVVFLLVELFYVPGFGILGITGIIFMVFGLVLTLVKNPFKFPSLEFGTALYTIAKAILITCVLGIVGFKFLPRTSIFKRIQLNAKESKDLGYQTKSLPENIQVGVMGTSHSVLRPSGRADFDRDTINVVTQGDFIDKDKKIKIVKIEGNKVFVEEVKEA